MVEFDLHLSPETLSQEPKIAFMFPGQGSQYEGMGEKLCQQYSEARETFKEADDTLGYSLSTICFKNPNGELRDTLYAQPAILTNSVAQLRVLQSGDSGLFLPSYVVGHSMGEVTELVAAGVLSFSDALKTVSERARLMDQAGKMNPDRPGGMGVINKLPADVLDVTTVCDGEEVVVANHNLPDQVVISGFRDRVESVLAYARQFAEEKGLRIRADLLEGVSIAAHSKLMENVQAEFKAYLETVQFNHPQVDVLLNGTRQFTRDVLAIQQNLWEQFVKGVEWVELMKTMRQVGTEGFIEIGPKAVLSGFLNKTRQKDADEKIIAIDNVVDLDVVRAAMRPHTVV